MKTPAIFLTLTALLLVQNVAAQLKRAKKISKLLERSAILNQYHAGFVLYDLDNRKMLVEKQGDKYFTPASNTKLYTFYAGLKMLKDSVPGLQYIERGDSLIFWGTGDPSLLHPDFMEQTIIEKLKASGKKLFWANGNYTGEFYGTGWSYDDYNEYYQPEISELPVYGNILRISNNNRIFTTVPLLSAEGGIIKLVTDSNRVSGKYRITREMFNNIFHQPLIRIPDEYEQDIPIKVKPELIKGLLAARLPLFVDTIKYTKPLDLKTWYSVSRDTLFKHMLLPSDNFIAEQLLLTYAAENNLEMNTSTVIKHVIKNYLADLPDKPQWVDGSGLSRQDLFTPRSMVKLCEKIYDEINDEERLFNLLPQGGKTGTLKNLYKGENKPFVFAKTGSLSNNSTLSGFLITTSGRRMIFSFMNNNYVRPTQDIRKEMERIITYIHQNY